MDATNRARTASAYMRQEIGSWGFTKAQLAAAVTAVDNWVDLNAATYNLALPLAFQLAATTEQKAALLGYVLWRRIGRLQVTEDG